MYVLAIAGPSNAGKTTLVERLADSLTDRGTVGTVKRIDCEPDIETEGKDTYRHRSAGASRTYGIAESKWFATGDDRSLDETLDELAVNYDYALVEGYSEADVPKVVLGEQSGQATEVDAGTVLARAETADDASVEEIVDALHETEPYETLPSLVERATESADSAFAGAIATFTGRVRARDHADDDPTEFLEFEKYDEVAEQRMATIREELESRDGVYEVLLHHRTGVLEAGEDIVFVVVLAGHRTEAFATVEDGINRLKEEVPLFKKEVTVNDEFWAHERQ